MWSTTIANLKENLNKIALDVHEYDDDDEYEDGDDVTPRISHSRDSYSSSDRRFSHNSAISSLPIANGFDSPSNPEIEEYKAEIKRLQESEAQIKALSLNYAALLKEKEEWISQLNEENSTLKHNLGATYAALDASKSENLKTSTSSPAATRGSDQSPNRQHKSMMKTRSFGKWSQNGVVTKENASMNGIEHYTNAAALKDKMEHSSIEGNEKELADLLEEKNRSLAALQAKHEEQIRQLRDELERERGSLASMQSRLQEEQKLYRSFQEEHSSLKVDNNKMLIEMNKVKEELSKRASEIRQLQMELAKKNNTEADGAVESLKRIVAALEKENNTLKTEKDELKSALEALKTSSQNILSSSANELSGSFPGKEEMELSLQKLEKDLKEVSRDRDKALNELNRLKQHLLDKESEESEKMDEDSKIIEELRENNEYLRAQIRNLEKSLRLAVAGQEEIKMINNNELQKSKEVIDVLNKKLASLTSTLDAKNVELLNLQTALGQYYAEIEAKERLDGDLASAREEMARLSELLKGAYQQVEISKREQEDCVTKLSQAERMIADGKGRINKLEEDNGKLRRALEQSMTRLNRMSMDSDYSVDRRIVIKLLVTYFQRNHSKEVLDLMVRMLGFSEEDKQRIGLAQQGAGKGVVRGVFGLPGRLVGGILGGSPAGSSSSVPSDNQSFADMWVDFLLKETEERERRESAKTMNGSLDNQHEVNSRNSMEDASQLVDRRFSSPPLSQYQSPQSSRGDFFRPEHSDSEFSTVPLASSDNSRHPKPSPRY